MIKRHFERPLQQTWPRTISGVVRAAFTVFTTPRVAGHDSTIFRTAAKNLKAEKIAMLPALEDELQGIEQLTAQRSPAPYRTISTRELVGEFGVLMQFTCYMPALNAYAVTDYQVVDKLYQAIIKGGKKKPLTLVQQLEIALSQTDGDVLEAIWRLFITTRQYARWFDAAVLPGMPAFSHTDAISRMETFSRSVAACKEYGDGPYQDTAGDTYYVWTHALGKLLYYYYGKQNILSRFMGLALHNGTRLNHGLAHRYNPQSVKSDHTIAARYGNAIGAQLVARLGEAVS